MKGDLVSVNGHDLRKLTIEVTRMFVIKPNIVKTIWAQTPYLALMTSRNVWAFGAFLFNSMAKVANRMIWTVAPEAYQKGPDTPYRYATPDDCSRVAAQVQELTTAEATKPDLTVLPAVLNISLV